MKEIICINIGQAGTQIGNSCWQLFCHQHGINPCGFPINPEQKDFCPSKTFFSQSQQGKFTPRNIMIDSQPTVIDQIRTGQYKDLFYSDYLVCGKQSAANNYSRGYFTFGKRIIQQVQNKIRKIAQNCNGLQGFLVFNAFGGGTGSGFYQLLMEKISYEYHNTPIINFAIHPSQNIANSTVQVYNTILANHSSIQHSDVNIVFDNEALYQISHKKLGIQLPTYKNINRIIAQVVSSLTASFIYQGPLNMNLNQLQTNLVPYRRTHFLLSSFASFLPAQRSYHQSLSVEQITKDVFHCENIMAKCDPNHGKYIGCSLMYRGDVIPSDVNRAIKEVKKNRRILFVDWCPTGFKVSINDKAPKFIPGGDNAKMHRSCSMISNNTAVAQVFSQLNWKFDSMYAKRAFVHWFVGNDLEQGYFSESREDLAALERQYEQIGTQTIGLSQQ